MRTQPTRRDFLKFSAAGLAASAATEALGARPSRNADNPGSGEITVRVTDERRRFEVAPAFAWRSSSGRKLSGDFITLNPERKFQEILGFGAAFTDASCYLFSQLSEDSRQQLFHELFHPSELVLNVCRTCIVASDYSPDAYCFDEGEPTPDLERSSVNHDPRTTRPQLRQPPNSN